MQVRVRHSVSVPGQSPAVRHWTHVPAPLQTLPPFWLHAVPAAAFAWVHVWVLRLQVSSVQGLPSPQSASLVQQPGIGSSPQVPVLQMPRLQGALGQSDAPQHCWQVPLQSVVPLGQAQVPF